MGARGQLWMFLAMIAMTVVYIVFAPAYRESIWETDQGRLALLVYEDNTVVGIFNNDDGRVEATFDPVTQIIEGTWTRPEDDRVCDTQREGTGAWGSVRWTLEDDERLVGQMSHCGDPVDSGAPWNGRFDNGDLPTMGGPAQ